MIGHPRVGIPALVGSVGCVLMLMAGCGSPAPTSKFVGNDSCPTTTTDAQGNTVAASPYPIPDTNGDPVGQLQDQMPHTHVNPPTKVDYLHDPPTSGCHYNIGATGQGADPAHQAPIDPGVYDREIAASQWVHNLEHGYIVVLYNCKGQSSDASSPKGCQGDFNALNSWFHNKDSGHPLPPDPKAQQQCKDRTTGAALINYPKVLVLPWHTMKPKFAIVSWDYYLDLGNSLSLGDVQRFYDNHVDQSPEGICTQ